MRGVSDAVRLDDETQHARVRSWVLPRVEDPQRRDALQRAAKREAEVLGRLGRHPNILGLIGTVDHEGLARLVFEPFEGALPLHQFLRAYPDLAFEHRLHLLEQVADALDRGDRDALRDRVVEELRGICLSLPETSEGRQFGSPTFRAGKKGFCTAHRHHGRAGCGQEHLD